MSDVPTSSTAQSGPGGTEKAKQVAAQTKDASVAAATDVKDTAKEQVQRVAGEAGAQARNVASEVRDRLGEQARTQNDRLVGTIRQAADQLDEMRGERGDSPAAAVVSRVADGGRQFADYLDHHGPDGVLREVQDFARRRPGAFLATALAAGFVVGRLGKSVAKADPDAGVDKPRSDSFVSGTDTAYTTPGYPVDDYATTGTGYTGTGTGTGYTGTGTGTGYTGAPATTPAYPAQDPAYPVTDPAYGTTTGYTTTATEYSATGTGTPIVEETYVVESPERPR